MNEEEIRLGKFDKWGYKNSFSKGELARELVYMNRDYEKLQQRIIKAIEYMNNVFPIEEDIAFDERVTILKIIEILKGEPSE